MGMYIQSDIYTRIWIQEYAVIIAIIIFNPSSSERARRCTMAIKLVYGPLFPSESQMAMFIYILYMLGNNNSNMTDISYIERWCTLT